MHINRSKQTEEKKINVREKHANEIILLDLEMKIDIFID